MSNVPDAVSPDYKVEELATSDSKDQERLFTITQKINKRLLSLQKHKSEPLSEYFSRLGQRARYKDGLGENKSTLDTIMEKTLLPLGRTTYKLRLRASAARARSLNSRYQYCCCTDVQRLATSFKADTNANMTLAELQESARKGCVRCRLIVECIMKYADQWCHVASSDIIVTGGNDVVHGTGSIAVFTVFWVESEVRKIYKGPPKWSKLELEIYYHEGGHALYPSMTPRRAIPTDIDAVKSANIILGWIDTCASQHAFCNEPPLESFAPNRLLDVSSKDGINRVRLINQADIQGHEVKFAALSYCWGAPNDRIQPIPMTRTNNIKDRCEGIPWEEMTPVFKDAIALVHCLGMRYIWIDALCIIQDDEQDFAREASQMASIYGKAHIVIAATRARTGDMGLFHSRPKAQTVSHIGPDQNVLSVFTRKPIEHDDFTTGEPRHFTTSPLFARAWCFQERLLARRVVHFAEDELLFECNEKLECECQMLSGDYGLYQNFKVASAHGLEKTSAKSRYQIWYSTLRPYTARSLTFEKDRLPALSGFAKLASVPEMGAYCAGLWRGELPQGLLWRVVRPLPEKNGVIERPDPYRAPTWSWAGVQAVVEGHVQFHPGIETTAKVADIQCVLASSDPFGEVTSAYVVLEAPVTPIELRAVPESGSNQRSYLISRRNKVDEEIAFEADLCIVPSRVLCIAIEHDVKGTRSYSWSCLIAQKDKLGDHYYRIGVVECPSHWLHSGETQMIKML